MADELFEHPRLAAIYDALDADRSDLEVYADVAAELGARTVVDIGCGTGTFALLLARRGFDVSGVDPAAASLAVARAKTGAGEVCWLHADASRLPVMRVDLATMTGNVAQAIADPADWSRTLAGVHAALRPGGRLVMETRTPATRAWEQWTRAASYQVTHIDDVGAVETWVEVTDVQLPLVTFASTFVFDADGASLQSRSTLRFRDRHEVVADLHAHGFVVQDVRDAPDRPGQELVFIAERSE